MPILFFCIELFILYIFSKHIALQLSGLFFRIFRNHKASGILLAILFLPGTLIHELAHFLMAILVRVKTHHFTLIPKIGVDSIILGSVGIDKPDLVRSFFIGTAPFFIGTFILLTSIYFFNYFKVPLNSWWNLVFIYGIFTVSNTMFSSKKDLEGALELLLIILVIFIIFLLFGFRFSDIPVNLAPLNFLFEKADKILLIPLGIDLVFLITIWILNKLSMKSYIQD